jgi:hypothetical protein
MNNLPLSGSVVSLGVDRLEMLAHALVPLANLVAARERPQRPPLSGRLSLRAIQTSKCGWGSRS